MSQVLHGICLCQKYYLSFLCTSNLYFYLLNLATLQKPTSRPRSYQAQKHTRAGSKTSAWGGPGLTRGPVVQCPRPEGLRGVCLRACDRTC